MEVSHLGPTGAIVLRNADKEWSIDAAIATTRNRRTVDRPVRDLTNRPNHAMADAAKVLISETVLCTWRIYMRLPEERNAFFLHHQHGSRHTYKPAIGVVVSNHTPILGMLDSFPVYPFLPFGFSNENYYRLIKAWSLYRTYVRPSLFRESISFVH